MYVIWKDAHDPKLTVKVSLVESDITIESGCLEFAGYVLPDDVLEAHQIPLGCVIRITEEDVNRKVQLAAELTQFAEDVDPYGFYDHFGNYVSGKAEAYETILDRLIYDPDCLIRCLENVAANDYDEDTGESAERLIKSISEVF